MWTVKQKIGGKFGVLLDSLNDEQNKKIINEAVHESAKKPTF